MANGNYDNTNSGALFTNDRKEKSTHPDYRGSINVDGVDYWISAWIKNGSKGKFLSLSVTEKDTNRQQTRNTNTQRRDDGQDFLDQTRSKADKHRIQPAPQPQTPAPDYDSFDDDIPF